MTYNWKNKNMMILARKSSETRGLKSHRNTSTGTLWY